MPHVACGVFVPALSGESLFPMYATPTVREALIAAPLRIGEGLSGWVAANRHTIVNSHADLDLGDAAHRLGLTACTSTPVFALGDLVAVFTVYTPRPLTTAEARNLGRLGQDIGLNVARAREASPEDSERLAAVSVA